MSVHPIRNIVAGTSLDLASDPVVARAAELAGRCGARLHLAHGHALPMALYGAPAGLSTVAPDLLDAERQVRLELLSQQLERVDVAAGRVASTEVIAGAPHRTVLDLARTVEADLIVLGGSEVGSFHLLGSTADRVLRKAACPVWVVQSAGPLLPSRIVAPVDLSEIAGECLLRGLEVARQVMGDSLPPVEALLVLTGADFEASPDKTSAEVEAAARADFERFLAGVAAGATPVLRSGDVRAEIVTYGNEAPSLLVLGTHSRSGFERFLLGSVASDVAAKSRQDVLIVPPAAVHEHHA
jgi:nucleotide-binding universal stress UspA family protein